jgi:hypothetical protein
MRVTAVSRREFIGQAAASAMAASGAAACRSTPATVPALSNEAIVSLTATGGDAKW